MAEHTTQTIRADGAPTFDLHIFGNVAWFNALGIPERGLAAIFNHLQAEWRVTHEDGSNERRVWLERRKPKKKYQHHTPTPHALLTVVSELDACTVGKARQTLSTQIYAAAENLEDVSSNLATTLRKLSIRVGYLETR